MTSTDPSAAASAQTSGRRLAVVLFNLGGPDSPDAVRPFLYNLFADPRIIGLPAPLRQFVARLISNRRAPIAREIYARIGGRSPILPETEAQARALEERLGPDAKVFIAMRYWHPRAHETARAVKAWGADEIVLLPLYPQFSTTTTESSLAEWDQAAASAGLKVPTRRVCCFPVEPGLVAAQVELVRQGLAQVPDGKARVLFSAHGLPEKTIKAGDPYQAQVERTAAAVAEALAVPGLDWRVTYQSRVGPLKWIGPATDQEIVAAGAEGLSLVVVPIAFVSEHSETLVELDIEYRHLADEAGVPHYVRVPAVATAAPFVDGLARLVQAARGAPAKAVISDGSRCPGACGRCPRAGMADAA
jgi:ferrochelatase